MKHKLIVIGFMGIKRAYLDIPREEAIRRYMGDDTSPFDEPVEEFEFENEFGVYDAWAMESTG